MKNSAKQCCKNLPLGNGGGMWGDKEYQICVRLTEEQFAKIEERGKKTGKKKSDVVRELIDEGLGGVPSNSGQKNSEGENGLAASTLAKQ